MENAISVQFTKYVNQRIKLKHFDGENCKTEADVHGAASTCFFQWSRSIHGVSVYE